MSREMPQEIAESIFTLAGVEVLAMKPLPDGYGFSPDDSRYFKTIPDAVWWFVKTRAGWVEIGWRWRVISIDWSDTPIRRIVTEDDVTKEDHLVHAGSITKAVEYLAALARELNRGSAKAQFELE